MSNEWDGFVAAMEDADEAMQQALKTVPGDYESACAGVRDCFRNVRATLMMGYEMRRGQQENDET
jgi:hypothetical protein